MVDRVKLMTSVCLFGVGYGNLVYQPVNPSFGGHPNNGSFLLQSATLQNDHKDPSSNNVRRTQTAAERFQERLDSIITSQIAASILRSVTDDEGNLIAGNVETESFKVKVIELGDSFIIQINDKLTGNSSEITIDSI
ncbi:curli assembly protein CsgF [Cysteiniphilum sp. 6C5]|uniref:curli assembly protein CsgF n=1 Tax=unclassified Cysteiniphilum TaxID=2610889 RepID=UPI003F86D845